jgi:hypothetical protein
MTENLGIDIESWQLVVCKVVRVVKCWSVMDERRSWTSDWKGFTLSPAS